MKNGKLIDWDARLERLEADVKEIKSMLLKQQEPKEPWWKSFVGMYANDPVAEEAAIPGSSYSPLKYWTNVPVFRKLFPAGEPSERILRGSHGRHVHCKKASFC